MTDQPQTPANDDGTGEQGTPTPGYGTPDAGGYGAASYPSTPSYPGEPGFPAAPKTNGLAIGSLVASLVGLLCGIGAIVGIVLGIIALNQIEKRGENGKGLAIAGIAVGAGAIVLSALFLAVL